MDYYKKELEKLSGAMQVKFYSDKADTRVLNLNYESINAIQAFLNDKLIEIKKEMYLDFKNNFISVDYFADYYEIDYNNALMIINEMREN